MSERRDLTDLVLRDATVGDVRSLIEILTAGTLSPEAEDPAHEEPYRGALIEILAEDQGTSVVVAEIDGEVVGMCQLIVFRHLQHQGQRCAELESLHVRAEWRGIGIGARLLDAVVARARALGCYRVQLTSNASRLDAHRFYEANGFAASHVGFKLGAPLAR